MSIDSLRISLQNLKASVNKKYRADVSGVKENSLEVLCELQQVLEDMDGRIKDIESKIK